MWKENGKKPILAFLGLTFIITWGLEAIGILIEHLGILSGTGTKIAVMSLVAFAALAPGFSVYILLKKAKLINGFKDYLSRVFKWKSPLSFFLTLAIVFTVFFINVFLTEDPNPELPFWTAPVLLLMMIPGGGWEELGWRGFLQPALEEKVGFIPATLIMGSIWAVWHLPLWLLQSANQKLFLFPSFALYCFALSFLLAVTYKATKSVFSVILLHAWGNTTCGGIFTFHVLENKPTLLNYVLYTIIITGSIIFYYLINNHENKISDLR